ncbi:hypothetical protein [Trujillonella endophytica]|uniref:Uncharacterized protein n=1 Tax=Trujillonella endophytica TaxID=673521 RepID=A0A1H8PDJ9_9ACTN|nr:hypothetical protein [Trujillella endophytica]SEO39708.1 hypothetical protein SAMN05660991_00104 [Trujillella endophytica]
MKRRTLLTAATTAPLLMTLAGSAASAEDAPVTAPVPDPQVYARRDEVPSLEETAVSVPLLWSVQPGPAGDLSNRTSNVNAPLLVLPFPWRLLSVDFVFDLGLGVERYPASDDDYWTFALLNASHSRPTRRISTYATRTVLSGGAEPIVQRRRWAPAGTMDAEARVFDTDGALYLNATRTGTPPTLVGPSLATLRYARA